MQTVLIDYQGNISDLRTTSPFLYPLMRDKKLKLFLSKTDNIGKQGLEEITKGVILHLQRNQIKDWQAIILINIQDKEIINREKDKFAGRLGNQLHLLNRDFLSVLQKERLMPDKVIVLVLDDLKRRQIDGAPVDKISQIEWELDTKGYLPEPIDDIPYLFTLSDFENMDKSFSLELDLSKENIDSFEGLTGEIQDRINTTIKELKKNIDVLLKKKKENIPKTEVAGTFTGIDNYKLDEIEEKFSYELTRIKDTNINRFHNFQPSYILKKVLFETLSIKSLSNDNYICIRFSFLDHGSVSHIWKLMELSFLIIFLIDESEDLDEKFDRTTEKYLYLEDIKIDEKKFKEVLLNYQKHLEINKEDVNKLLKKPLSADIELTNPDHCKCEYGIQEDSIERNSVFQLDYWDAWVDKINKIFDEKIKEADEQIKECRESISNRYGSKIKANYILEEKIKKFKEEKERLQKDLASKEFRDIKNNWYIEIKNINDSVRDIFIWMPKRGQIVATFLTMLTAFLIIIIPYLWCFINLNPDGILGCKKPVFYIPVLIVVLICILIYYVIKLKINIKLKQFFRQAALNAEDMMKKIVTDFNNNCEQISSLCKYQVAVKNLQVVTDKEIEKKIENEKLLFHEKELCTHIDWSKNFTHNFSCELNDYSNTIKLNHEISVMEGTIYSPLSYWKDYSNYSASIGTSNLGELTSKYLFAVDYIKISKDKAYSRD
ncbi:MAG: hypothetical protein HQK79_22210 [Desulfobacterales bacterium]|nr:hypothetical protein [Desulfobacterales bacterium]